jgi:hypothetical protein
MEILKAEGSSQYSLKKRDAISTMYTRIIESSVSNDNDRGDFSKLFKRIVGSIIILFETVATSDLTELLDVSASDIKRYWILLLQF